MYCRSFTLKNEQCANKVIPGSNYCKMHSIKASNALQQLEKSKSKPKPSDNDKTKTYSTNKNTSISTSNKIINERNQIIVGRNKRTLSSFT